MGEASIWIAVIVVGMMALGVREYARTSGTFSARLEQLRFAAMAGGVILLAITSAVLAVGFIIAVVIVEIWRPLLIVSVILAGIALLIYWLARSRK